MAKEKVYTKVDDKAAGQRVPPALRKQPASPEKQAGPMTVQRATDQMQAPAEETDTAGRGRAMSDLQQTGGNARVSRLLDTAPSASVIQRSPLSDNVSMGFSKGGKGEVFNILRARGPLKSDPDLVKWLDKTFGSNTDPDKMTDDRWLADQLITYGAEPHWPINAIMERQHRAQAHGWAAEPGNIEGTFDVGPGKTAVKAYYFPGKSGRRAMIIGGVHGTEASGVEVVNLLLDQMRKPGAKIPFYSVIIVPVLFPENLTKGTRTTTPKTADPNRNFPDAGKGLADARAAGIKAGKGGPIDSQGRLIEPENLVLLDLIERFQPERIASVHGHSAPPAKPKKDQDMPGIFDDPRAGTGEAKADDDLALKMAKAAAAKGVRVPGNRLGTKDETPHYPLGAPKLSKGVSLGDWGPRAAGPRPAMTTVTVEVFGNQTSTKAQNPTARKAELESLASVLSDVFLGPP